MRTVVHARGRSVVRRLLTGTALVGVTASALVAAPAFADNECGATTAGTVTCPASGNPYPNGITYTSPAVDPADDPGLDPAAPVYDLTVNLGDGVAIQSGANAGVAIIGFNDGAASLNAFGNTGIAVTGTGATGVIGNTNYGDLTINTESIFAQAGPRKASMRSAIRATSPSPRGPSPQRATVRSASLRVPTRATSISPPKM
jgi:hypothetical protein